ncbi:MAG: hypothetical protein KDA47_09030 [Planctomycetales bacterium]|nr:hypothetical protein [Planctomycetales bacterium]
MKGLSLILAGIMLTVMSWGIYGSVLHKGQHLLGNDRLKPLICVGVAYLLVAILVPIGILTMTGKLSGGWTASGMMWSTMAGVAGAFGALGIVIAMTAGGNPIYVMPLVFGGAPIVNVVMALYIGKGFSVSATMQGLREAHPIFYSGIFMVVMGAALVLIFKPGGPPKSHSTKPGKSDAEHGKTAAAADDGHASEASSEQSASATDTPEDSVKS